MKLSVVTTLYRSEKYIEEFFERTSLVAKKLVEDSYEIIFVNDGSPDSSLEVAVELAKVHASVKVIDLSRNFGHHKAMMTGLTHACGEKIFLIDSDLEEDPEWLLLFDRKMNVGQDDVVYGVQQRRKGRIVERLSGNIFYFLFRKMTGIAQPNSIVTARLMKKKYVTSLVSHGERELNIGGLWVITGFKQSPMPVQKHSTSPTTYSFSKKLDHAINAITSFSSKPLTFIFYSGTVISVTAAVFILSLLVRYFFISVPPSGYTSIIASVWFFSGLIIFFIGLQGVYIGKIFSEVKQRPFTIIKDIHQSKPHESSRVDSPK
jgi:putative glycosyltransferase